MELCAIPKSSDNQKDKEMKKTTKKIIFLWFGGSKALYNCWVHVYDIFLKYPTIWLTI